MAKHHITRSCGHADTIQVYGPMKDRHWKVQREEAKTCRACWLALQRKLDEAENAELALPALIGSEKQVAWATSLRLKGLRGIEKKKAEWKAHLARSEASEEQASQMWEMIESLTAKLLAKTDSRWWIEHRHLCMGDAWGGNHLLTEMERELAS